jgi:hypothetical protein
MKRTIVSLLMVVLISVVKGQNGYHISKPEPSFQNNILTIKYDITGCGSNEFVDIKLILVNSGGDTLRPRSITGDIGKMISCGSGKSIEWNLEKDKITMDNYLEIFLTGVKSAPPNTENATTRQEIPKRGNVMLSSIFVPGLGQKKASGKSAHLIFSGVVYGSLGTSVYFLLKANDYKEKYYNASGTLRDEMFNKWQVNYNMSKIFGFGTAGVWVTNMIWSTFIPIKVLPEQDIKVTFCAPFKDGLLISAKWNF